MTQPSKTVVSIKAHATGATVSKVRGEREELSEYTGAYSDICPMIAKALRGYRVHVERAGLGKPFGDRLALHGTDVVFVEAAERDDSLHLALQPVPTEADQLRARIAELEQDKRNLQRLVHLLQG